MLLYGAERLLYGKEKAVLSLINKLYELRLFATKNVVADYLGQTLYTDTSVNSINIAVKSSCSSLYMVSLAIGSGVIRF